MPKAADKIGFPQGSSTLQGSLPAAGLVRDKGPDEKVIPAVSGPGGNVGATGVHRPVCTAELQRSWR